MIMEKYENIMNKLKNIEESFSIYDCFFQLVEGVDMDSLDNLLDRMVEYYRYSFSK